MKYSIRDAEAKDQESILLLMKEHALFEGHELEFSKQHQQFNYKKLAFENISN